MEPNSFRNMPLGEININIGPSRTPIASLHGRVIDTHRIRDRVRRFFSIAFKRGVEFENIILDIQSIIDNFHVSKEQVLRASRQGNLTNFLDVRHEQVSIVAKVPNLKRNEIPRIYQSVLGQFNEVNGELFYKDDDTSTGLTSDDIKEAIEGAFEKPDKKSFRFWRGRDGNQRYIIKRLEKGGYSKIYIIIDINEALAGVFKDAIRNSLRVPLQETTRDIQMEYRNLCLIHADKTAVGVQFKPKLITKIRLTSKHGGAKDRFGYIGYRYDGDYYPEFDKNLTLEERLLDCYQLLSGLKTIHENGLLHGDIKPENILIKRTEKMKLVHIADLGGARRIEDVSKLADLVSGGGARAASPSYTVLKDLFTAEELAKYGQGFKLIELEQKRDIFSLGCVLYSILTGYESFSLDKKKFPVKYIGFSEQSGADVPIKMKELVDRMVSMEPDERPSAAEAFDFFKDFLYSADKGGPSWSIG